MTYGRLIEGLKARGLYENTVLIIVSDHGMAATSPERVTVLDDIIDPDAGDIVHSGPVAFLNPLPPHAPWPRERGPDCVSPGWLHRTKVKGPGPPGRRGGGLTAPWR